MARERMITRSIVVVDFTVMVVNTNVGNVVDTAIVSIPSADSIKDIESAIKANLLDGLLFVQIVSKERREVLYGMSESDFIMHASVLPPRTKADADAE